MANLKNTTKIIEYAMKRRGVKHENSYEVFATVKSVEIQDIYYVKLKLEYTNERGTGYFFKTVLLCDDALGCRLNDKDFKEIERILIGKKARIIVDAADRSKYVVDDSDLQNEYQQYMNELVKRPEQIEFVNQYRNKSKNRDVKLLVFSFMFLGGILIIIISNFIVNDISLYMYIGLTLSMLGMAYYIINSIIKIYKTVSKIKCVKSNGISINASIQSATLNTEHDGEGLSTDYINLIIKYLDTVGNIYFTNATIYPETGHAKLFNEASYVGRQVSVYVNPNDYNECVVDRNSIPKI